MGIRRKSFHQRFFLEDGGSSSTEEGETPETPVSHSKSRTKTLQKHLEEVEDRLRYLQDKIPAWRLYGSGGEVPAFYTEIRRLQTECESIILELTKRRKWNTQTENSKLPKPRLASNADRRESIVRPMLRSKGWSTLEWAQESGVDFHTASSYLKGKTKPYQSTRKKLADSLGIPGEDLPD
jgi:hypothetical protein